MFGGKKVLSSDSLSDMNPDVSVSIFSKEFQKTIKRARDVLKVSKTGECYRILGIDSRKETINMCEAAERAFKEERKEGIEEGMEKGIEKAVEKMATKMIHAGKPDEEIMEFTELTKEQLDSLKEKLLQNV